jgi:hypothetical protein
MSEREFEENARRYVAGELSRRRFIQRMVMGGVSLAAAGAFANALATGAIAAPRAGSGQLYGNYGTPPGIAKKPAGFNPPGLGGTPPGQGGTPPGQALKKK